VPSGAVSLVQGKILAATYYCASYNSTICPNNTYLWGAGYTFKLWAPRGPHQVEVWTWPIVEKDMPADLKRAVAEMWLRTLRIASRSRHPAGMRCRCRPSIGNANCCGNDQNVARRYVEKSLVPYTAAVRGGGECDAVVGFNCADLRRRHWLCG